MTIERAIERLRAEYERARKNPTVRKPLAYALYHTWRYYDAKEREKGEGDGRKCQHEMDVSGNAGQKSGLRKMREGI